nr:MAG TPA: hypothetical protein [Caudoviricetes sp.]
MLIVRQDDLAHYDKDEVIFTEERIKKLIYHSRN